MPGELWKIDRNPRLIAFAGAAPGKLALLAVMALGLYVGDHPFWAFTAAALVFPTFFPLQRHFFLCAANAAAWVLIAGAFRFRVPGQVFPDWLAETAAMKGIALEPYDYLAVGVLAISVSFFCFFLVARVSDWPPARRFGGLALFTAMLVAVYHLAHWFPEGSLASLVLVGALLFLGKAAWYFLYSQSQEPTARPGSLARQFFTFSPFWATNGTDVAPVPRGHRPIEEADGISEERAASLRLNAVRLLFWCVALRYAGVLLTEVTTGVRGDPRIWAGPTLGLVGFYDMGLGAYNALQLPWYFHWGSAMVVALRFVLYELAGGIGMMVAVLRFCGVYAFRPVHKPWEATHFTDFFNRVFFYYNQVILQFFFFPAWSFFRFLNFNRKARKFVTTFTAVLLGGFFIHLFRDAYLFASAALADGVYQSSLRYPYYIGLALLCGVSSMRLFGEKLVGKTVAPVQAVRVFVFFALYSFCRALGVGSRNENVTWDERWVFILSFFGL